MAKIMLVDDAAFMRMMIKKALSASGYNDFIEAPCLIWTDFRL